MTQRLVQCQDNPSPTRRRIRVVIADDAYLMREALERIMGVLEGIELVGFCSDRDSLLEAIELERPDAILTDIRMPPTGTDEGIQVARTLHETHPEIGVVVLSQFVDPSYVLGLLESGSARRAYLLKERVSDPEQLLAAIEAVVEGGSVIDPKVVEVLVRARNARVQSPLAELTPRERDVLAELAQGKSNAAIARVARPHQARGREAHQLDLHQAGAGEPRRRQPAGQGGFAVPGQRQGRAS